MSQQNKNNNIKTQKNIKIPRKPNNFSKSFKKILKEMKGSKLILISLVLAMISSILAVYAPTKLSDLTDEISKGIKIDTEKMEDLSIRIGENLQSANPSEVKFEDTRISLSEQRVFLENMGTIQRLNSDGKELSGEKQNNLVEAYENIPNSIKQIIEPRLDFDTIKNIAILLSIVYLISGLFNYLQVRFLVEACNNFAKNLRRRISLKINRLPLNYFDTNQIGDILSRTTNDVDSLAANLPQSLTNLGISITMVIGSVVMMIYTNWVLALVAIFSSLFGFVFMFLILSKSQKYFRDRQIELGKLNGHIEEIFSGLKIVKAYNAKKQTTGKFNELNENMYQANIMSKFLSGLMQPIMMFVGNFGYLAVSIVGAVFAKNGDISFGVIVAFMAYIRLFTNPLSRIAQGLQGLQSSVAASERIFNFMDEEELSDENNFKEELKLENVKGKIEFKNIEFKYPSNDNPTIKDFSVTAMPGQKIAIVGPTGAGKSTMVNLLMKFYEISKGDILIDGVSIHNIKRKNIHNLFTMVLQDTWLFNGTIRDNIIYNMEEVSEEKLVELSEYLGLNHFIKTLPKGFDTVISDSNSVSAGQKQLLTIARGMLKDAPFLILDEATSNVDTRTEEIVQSAMDKLMKGRTSFIIAHRLSTIVNSDLIIVMDNGNIVEQGTHEELMNKNGFYADLYNSQFSLK